MNQTYTDMEMIVVDDGATDSSPVLCDKMIMLDCRIKVIHKSNGGLSSARNIGISVAVGDYIGFVDSDDYIDLNMYETLVKTAKYNNAEISVCSYKYIKPNGIYIKSNSGAIRIFSSSEALDDLYFSPCWSEDKIGITVWNKIYQRSIFEHFCFNNDLLVADDVYATPVLLSRANRIVLIDTALYNVYFTPNSLSRSSFNITKLTALIAYESLLEFYSQTQYSKYKEKIEAYYINHLFYLYYNCYQYKNSAMQFGSELSRIHDKILACFTRALCNRYLRSRRISYILFRVSPLLYVQIVKVFLILKRIVSEVKRKGDSIES